MNCDEFRSAVLSGDDGETARAHEATCASCHAQAADLRAAASTLASEMVWEEPSPELGRQIQAMIGAAAHGGGETSGPRRLRSRWLAVASVAASIAVVSAVIGLWGTEAPDWEVALPGTELATGAAGTVRGWNEDSGTRMIVAIDGLAPAPDGFFYEFWLSDGPIHVSAGTFRTGGEIELWSGVS